MIAMDITIPRSWQELKPSQLVDVSRLFLQEMDQPTFLTKAFIKISGLSPVKRDPFRDRQTWYWFIRRKGKPFLVSAAAISEITWKLKFLLEPVEDVQPPDWNGSKPYKLPKRRLYNLSVEQYLYAELAFSAYNKHRTDEYLYKIMAILWPPKRGLEADRIGSHAEKFKKLDPAIPRAAFLFYAGARRYLAGEFPHVFSGSAGNDDDFDVTSLVRALNGGDVTKNEGILRSQLWDALKQLEDMAVQAEAARNQMKKA